VLKNRPETVPYHHNDTFAARGAFYESNLQPLQLRHENHIVVSIRMPSMQQRNRNALDTGKKQGLLGRTQEKHRVGKNRGDRNHRGGLRRMIFGNSDLQQTPCVF
jgi:hypothetical protein